MIALTTVILMTWIGYATTLSGGINLCDDTGLAKSNWLPISCVFMEFRVILYVNCFQKE